MTSFDGSMAFVVGGSLGIGLAVGERLAEGGADIVVFARRSELLLKAADTIRRRSRRPQQRVEWRQLDVADRNQVESVLGATVAELGAPDVLVNCAGRARPTYFEKVTPAQLEETLRINLVGSWNTIQTLVPHMRRRGGYIVNTASLAGLIGVFG